MFRSSNIRLALLGGGALAFSACVCSGCGKQPVQTARTVSTPDNDWYDASGKKIEQNFTSDEEGNVVPAEPVFDRNGNPVQFDSSGNRITPAPMVTQTVYSGGTSTHTSGYRNGSIWPWYWGSSYRSYSSGPSYSSGSRGPSNTGSTYFGGSRPSGGGSSSSPSVSRGGFGSSSSSASSSASS